MLLKLVCKCFVLIAVTGLIGCDRSTPAIVQSQSESASNVSDEVLNNFLQACSNGDLAKLRKILESTGPGIINSQTRVTGDTPLLRATENGQFEIVRFLLESGAQPNLNGLDGNVPLLQAAYEGHAEIVDVLLKYGADPNVTEARYGDTPLIMAAWKGHSEVVSLLLAGGADVNAKGKDGRTALSMARRGGFGTVESQLLSGGATEQ